MLELVLRHIHNRFERDCIEGSFTIEGGELKRVKPLEEQYYWIEGSVLNDGLHQHPASDLQDEQFDGAVWLLAIPKQVVELAARISDWAEKNQDTLDSPYQSESFGGYTYTKASGSGSGSGDITADGWMAQFRSELNPYRKLYDDWKKN